MEKDKTRKKVSYKEKYLDAKGQLKAKEKEEI